MLVALLQLLAQYFYLKFIFNSIGIFGRAQVFGLLDKLLKDFTLDCFDSIELA